MKTAALEFSRVSFGYNGAPVLVDVDLLVAEGELVSVVGPNGGGKTTLLKLALGLLPPSRGEVKVFGERAGKSRRRIGYAPQRLEFDRLFPITTFDVVLHGRLGWPGARGFFGWPARSDRAAARRALERVELFEKQDLPFAELSGGQRQRALIARALAVDPELLLLDEPTANVDAESETRLSALIEELQGKVTMVMVSHDPLFVSGMVEHVVCVNRTVKLHPTGKITGEEVVKLHDPKTRIVHHDQVCPDRDHRHD